MEDLFDADFYRGVLRRGVVTGLAATAIHALARAWSRRNSRGMTFAGVIASQLVQAQTWRRGEAGDAFFTGALGTSWAALGLLTTIPTLRRPLGMEMLGPVNWVAILGVSFGADRLATASVVRPRLNEAPVGGRRRGESPTNR